MRALRLCAVVISVLSVSCAWDPGSASAWIMPDHQRIAVDAISVLPEPLKALFESHRSRVLHGVVAPDLDPAKQWYSHMLFLVAYRGTIQRGGDAVFLLKEWAGEAEKLISKGGDLGQALFAVAQATHLVQDLNQPLHEVWGQTAREHAEIEGRMTYLSWPTDDRYRGFHLVKKYGCFGQEIARRSAESSMPLINATEDEFRWIVRVQWDAAVNDVANFWQSVFVNALGPEEAERRYGIPRPMKEVGKGWLC